MTNVPMTELEQLKAKRKEILSNCSGWMKCQDGSYEMALHHAGYDSICEKIAKLESEG